MNYSELKALVADTLNRADLTALIPSWIVLCEGEINATIRHRKMLQRSSNTFDEHYLILPDDFLEAKNIQLNTDPAVSLQYITMEHADLLRSGIHQTPGQPKYYTIIGEQLEATPIPDAAYEVEMAYYARLASLSDSNTSNWLSTLYPAVYLYGTLKHSAPYLKNDERILIWDGLYKEAAAKVNAESERSEVSGATPIARNSTRW